MTAESKAVSAVGQTTPDVRADADTRLTDQQVGWVLGLVRARVNKQRRRIANVSEYEGTDWHLQQLKQSLVFMEDALDKLEQEYEDVPS